MCVFTVLRAQLQLLLQAQGARVNALLASSLLGLVLGSLLCLSLCPACWRSAFGRTEVRRAASRGQLRGRAGLRFGAAAGRALRALWVLLYALRGAAFARTFSPALGAAVKESRARPTKCARDDRLIKGRWQSFGSPSDRLQRLCMPKRNKRVCL